MSLVTLYKPNGEVLLSTNVTTYNHGKNGELILNLQGEDAKVYGSTAITTLPYFICSN
jgi:hypothetical protein